MSESDTPRRGAVRALATVFAFATVFIFVAALGAALLATLPFAADFTLADTDAFVALALIGEAFTLAFAFFTAGFCFFDFLGAVFFFAMPGV